jgi:hypothetical protein
MPPTGKDGPMSGDELASGMLGMLDMIAPIREAMKGFKAQLIADGWSEMSAEQIATNLFIDLMHKPFER